MKKLFLLSCVAVASVLTLSAQVKNVKSSALKMDKQEVVKLSTMPSLGETKSPSSYSPDADQDTIMWPVQYMNNGNNDCNQYISYMWWRNAEDVEGGIYSYSMWMSPFGAAYSGGTNEIGAAVNTKKAEYANYANIDMSVLSVVGAVARYFRTPSSLWGDASTTVKAIVKGYPNVVDQNVYIDITTYSNGFIVPTTFPVDVKDYSYTDTFDFPVSLEQVELSNGQQAPKYSTWVGGIWSNPTEMSFRAGNDFALSMRVITPHPKYDTLLNWSMGIHSAKDCNLPNRWNNFVVMSLIPEDPEVVRNFEFDASDEEIKKVPFDSLGILPAGNPQVAKTFENNHEAFIYAMSYGWNGAEALTAEVANQNYNVALDIYPIVQLNTANESAVKEDIKVSIYPIPAVDKVTITSIELINKVEIYNAAGALVEKIDANTCAVEYNVEKLSQGTYFAKIYTKNGVSSKKLLVM